MISVDVPGHGIAAFDFEDVDVNFERVGWLTGSRPAISDSFAKPIELRVEVMRRLGGLSPRALLGGVFVPQDDSMFTVEVAYTGPETAPVRWPSHLSRRAFIAGLPDEFARAVVDELVVARQIPAGRLRIEHAGYDEMDSSTVAFRQAARLFGDLLVAEDRDAMATVRDGVSRW